MATITTRSGKGSPLTNSEVDSNFSNINTELGQKESASNKGVANGYASLDGSGKVPSAQLPSYVDDVVEGANLAALPATGETGKIYVTLDTNKTYRWSGSAYVEISASPGSTDAVTEGSTNLYFTNARARSAISASGSLSYNSSTGVLSYTAPTAVSQLSNDSGYITSSALSPYLTSATAASTYQTALVSGTSIKTVNGNSLLGSGNIQIDAGVASFNTRTGAITLTSGDVTTALGFTPYNATNPSGYITGNQTITISGDASGSGATSIALTLANSGVAAGTYTKVTVDAKGRVTTGASLASGDLPTYTGTITSGQVTTALGYTPYNATNPSGYITGITSGMVTTALGYTPYNSSNPSGYTNNTGTVTSVSGTGTVSGLTLTGTVTGSGSLTLGGSITGFLPTSGGTLSGGLTGIAPTVQAAITGVAAGNAAFRTSETNIGTTAGYIPGFGQTSTYTSGYRSHMVLGSYRTASGWGGGPFIAWGGNDSYATEAWQFNTGGSITHTGGRTFLDSTNYNSYSPTLTGAGASGTWGISISGNAATSTVMRYVGYAGDVGNLASAGTGIISNYNTSGAWTGAPSGMSYGSVYHLGGSGGGSILSLQIAADINHNSTSSTKQLWFRTSNNLGFQNDWKELLHSGNYSSYALPLSGGTLTGAIYVGTTGSVSATRALRVGPSGGSPASFGSYSGSWRSTIEIWDNAATRMLHLTPPDGENYNWSSIKSVGAGLRIDVGGSGGTNAIDIGTNGVANFPQGLQQGGNQVLHAGNFTSYVPYSYPGWPGSPGTDANSFHSGNWVRSSFTYSNNAPHTGTIVHFPSSGYDLQLNGTYGGQQLSFRNRNGDNGSWNTWRGVLHDGNYNSYSPSLTGSGASGTWSINITGSAGSASSLAGGGTINNANFNGIMQFPSGGGGATFGANHYSMGKDIANGGWSHPHYSDLIIGYHTGIRIGGAYSGVRFYNNSPTTDANNDGNGDAGETLLMTVGGHAGGTGVIINNTLTAGNVLIGASQVLHAGNYTSYSPSLGGSGASGTWGISISGSAAQLNGYSSAENGASVVLRTASNGYLYLNNWIAVASSGLFSGVNGAHWRPSAQSYGSWEIIGSKNGYTGIACNGTSHILNWMVDMGGNLQGWYNQSYGWQMYWSGGALTVFKNAYGGGTAATVLDSVNYTSYAPSYSSGGTFTGLWYFASNRNTTSDSCPLQAFSNNGSGATMSFHRGGYYAVNFGLDSDNVMRIGGWSAAANRWQLDMSGNGTYAGNVTAYSDERLKKDWSPISGGFVDRLACILAGTYTRIDSGERQAGVSAQKMREILPEVVSEDNEGTLALAYGNAAMVSAVELAKELVMLKRELAEIKSRLH